MGSTKFSVRHQAAKGGPQRTDRDSQAVPNRGLRRQALIFWGAQPADSSRQQQTANRHQAKASTSTTQPGPPITSLYAV